MKNTTRFKIAVRQYGEDVIIRHDGLTFIVQHATRQHVEETFNEEDPLHFDIYAVLDTVYEGRWDYAS